MLLSIFLAVAYTAQIISATTPPSKRRLLARGPTGLFHPKSSYQTFGSGVEQPLIRRDNGGLEAAALTFVESQLNVNSSSVDFKSGYSADSNGYAYIRQKHDNIPFANAVANIAYKDNKVVAFGHSFVNISKIASSTPRITVASAITTAQTALKGTYNGFPTTIEYLVQEDGSVALTYVIQVRDKKAGIWAEAFVDAHSGQFLSSTNFVTYASYRVLPITEQNITQGIEVLTDPQDLIASPLGWHNDGTNKTTDTSGNNVIAFLDANMSATTPESSDGLVFDYVQDPSVDPQVPDNQKAATTNVFYVVNTVHDISYRYGFTEDAFNFQQTNPPGTGGIGGDRILASVQNSLGIDNAAFATPSDGQSGEMFMFIWDITNPRRDGSLENDIITHENTHGITNRMTGGGTARCLQIVESQGLGEGWSDTMAMWTEQTSGVIQDFTLGSYVNGGAPIRSKPYSTNSTTNPYTYSTLQVANGVHAIGEVWANILFNVYAPLVKKYGFSKTAAVDPTGTEGNVVFLHLFIDSLALQPCQPDFLQARDAWIQADWNRYGGAHRCLLWAAFASRGLGHKASDYTDDFTVPSDCRK